MVSKLTVHDPILRYLKFLNHLYRLRERIGSVRGDGFMVCARYARRSIENMIKGVKVYRIICPLSAMPHRHQKLKGESWAAAARSVYRDPIGMRSRAMGVLFPIDPIVIQRNALTLSRWSVYTVA